MSGGSYDYLSLHDLAGVFSRLYELQRMGDRLAGLGYARRAANDTRRLYEKIKELEREIAYLRPVWHAVEWWDSDDWGEDKVKEALRIYETE